jgi:hypothetical protein
MTQPPVHAGSVHPLKGLTNRLRGHVSWFRVPLRLQVVEQHPDMPGADVAAMYSALLGFSGTGGWGAASWCGQALPSPAWVVAVCWCGVTPAPRAPVPAHVFLA